MAISQGDVPETARKHVPRYPLVSATLIGRLAVAKGRQGRRLGAVLLADALQRAFESAGTVGSSMVIVDALDDEIRIRLTTGAGEAPGEAKSALLRPPGKHSGAQCEAWPWCAAAPITGSSAGGKPGFGDCIRGSSRFLCVAWIRAVAGLAAARAADAPSRRER